MDVGGEELIYFNYKLGMDKFTTNRDGAQDTAC